MYVLPIYTVCVCGNGKVRGSWPLPVSRSRITSAGLPRRLASLRLSPRLCASAPLPLPLSPSLSPSPRKTSHSASHSLSRGPPLTASPGTVFPAVLLPVLFTSIRFKASVSLSERVLRSTYIVYPYTQNAITEHFSQINYCVLHSKSVALSMLCGPFSLNPIYRICAY